MLGRQLSRSAERAEGAHAAVGVGGGGGAHAHVCHSSRGCGQMRRGCQQGAGRGGEVAEEGGREGRGGTDQYAIRRDVVHVCRGGGR